MDAIHGLSQILLKHSPIIAFEQEAREIVDGSSATLDEIRRAGYAYLYAIEPRRSILSHTIPGMFRIPLELLEILVRGDGRNLASIREVDMLEKRQYSMLLVSKSPVALDQ